MPKYRVSLLARSDLDAIWDYIARDSQHSLFYQHRNRREIVTVNGGHVVHEVFA